MFDPISTEDLPGSPPADISVAPDHRMVSTLTCMGGYRYPPTARSTKQSSAAGAASAKSPTEAISREKGIQDGNGRDELGGDSACYCVDVRRSHGVK
ncbi:uncharacterized protein PAN0_003d2031 [Moesziomyces antarcticus]|uniref:uncharacterized protein n=1 Tax=Pseudozyma antarctica TaxID=84753 RepID=UPI0007196482|nr:uncharacterized protein PAN0_003d2031 [Moesziomyces antarcticus]GAK63822.1 hypothetical protein PAN0_003d2031 [Moesziomyces antarcticus]